MNVAIVNILLFLILFLYFKTKPRTNLCIKFIILEYLISALFGLFFIEFGDREYYNLSYYGSFIFYLFFLVSILPLIQFDKVYSFNSNEKFLGFLGTIIFYGSFLPLIDSLFSLYTMFSSGNLSAYMLNAHDARFVTNAKNISNIFVDISIKTAYYCRAFLPLLLMYYLNYYKKANVKVWGILITQISLSITSLTTSSRFMLADFAITYIFTYFLLYDYLCDYAKQFLKKLFKYGGIVLIGVLGVITIGRAISMGYVDGVSTLAWVSLYLGEGMLNFNEYAIHEKVFQGAVTSFPIFAPQNDLQMMQSMTSNEFSDYWQLIWGHDANTFKSVFGDFVCSFGVLYSLVGLLLFSLFAKHAFRKCGQSFSGLALIITLMKFSYFGFMYFPYSGVSGNNYMLQSIVAIIIIYIFERYGKKTT